MAASVRGRSVAWLGLVLLVLVVAGGCVSETKAGDKTIFTYEWWVPLSVMVGGIVAAPAGWFLRESISRLSIGLMILGPLACIFGLSLFTDRAEVDPTSYLVRVGIFGSASYSGKIDDITQISFTTKRGRRGSRSHYMVCHKKDGDTDEIAMGNSISKKALPLILEYASAKGVPIQAPID